MTDFTQPLLLRLCVGSTDGPRSGVWRLWSNKSDVYCGARSLASQFKVSLHEGGECNAAYTTEFARKLGGLDKLPKGQRRRDSWQRQTNVGDGLAVPVDIVFPTDYLGPIPDTHPDYNTVSFIEPAPRGSAISLIIAFGVGQPTEMEWPGMNRGFSQVGASTLPNGETVWVLKTQSVLSDHFRAETATAITRAHRGEPQWSNGVVDKTSPSMRMVLGGNGPDNRRVFADVSLHQHEA